MESTLQNNVSILDESISNEKENILQSTPSNILSSKNVSSFETNFVVEEIKKENDISHENCVQSNIINKIISPKEDFSYEIDRIDFSNTEDGILPNEFKEEAEFDLHEKQEWINRDVEALRDMVLSEPGLLGKTDKLFLLAFLRARKFDYEKAMQMIRGYYTSHQENKDLYLHLLPAALSHIWPLNMQTVLSKPDLKGRTVLLFFTEAWDPETIKLDDVFRAQVLILEHIVRLPVTQLKGVAAIVDCKGLSFNQVCYLTPSHIKRMVSVLQEIFPLRFKALHFVNEPSIFEWAFSLVKPFLSDTIKGRLHFHGENLQELQCHFPSEILPDVLGGQGGDVDNSRLVDILYKNESYFRDHFSCGYVADDLATGTADDSPQNSVLNTVAGVGSYIGSYYRRMCIE